MCKGDLMLYNRIFAGIFQIMFFWSVQSMLVIASILTLFYFQTVRLRR